MIYADFCWDSLFQNEETFLNEPKTIRHAVQSRFILQRISVW